MQNRKKTYFREAVPQKKCFCHVQYLYEHWTIVKKKMVGSSVYHNSNFIPLCVWMVIMWEEEGDQWSVKLWSYTCGPMYLVMKLLRSSVVEQKCFYQKGI